MALYPHFSPHFGGLREASVKSIKTHLVKMIGNTMLTYEELNTLCRKSNNPDEFIALTPAHLLIGESIVSPLEPYHDPERTPTKRLNYMQTLRQKFDLEEIL